VTRIRRPTLHTAGLAAAEAAANAALRLSPHSVEALRKGAGEVLAIECTRPELTLFIESTPAGELKLRGVHEGAVATRVSGRLEDFADLARAEDPAAALINGDLRLDGSSATLLAMQRIFADLDIDWEAPLVAGLGDVAGHQLAQVLQAMFQWSRQAGTNLQRQLREYTTEEGRLGPPPLALEHFYEDIQTLSERSERLAQRIDRLRQRARALLDAQ